MRYVVKDGHTLGYYSSENKDSMSVLSGLIRQGGHDWKNGPVSTFGSDIRPATEEDFQRFRVALPSDFSESKHHPNPSKEFTFEEGSEINYMSPEMARWVRKMLNSTSMSPLIV